jgi:hypothetical protein
MPSVDGTKPQDIDVQVTLSSAIPVDRSMRLHHGIGVLYNTIRGESGTLSSKPFVLELRIGGPRVLHDLQRLGRVVFERMKRELEARTDRPPRKESQESADHAAGSELDVAASSRGGGSVKPLGSYAGAPQPLAVGPRDGGGGGGGSPSTVALPSAGSIRSEPSSKAALPSPADASGSLSAPYGPNGTASAESSRLSSPGFRGSQHTEGSGKPSASSAAAPGSGGVALHSPAARSVASTSSLAAVAASLAPSDAAAYGLLKCLALDVVNFQGDQPFLFATKEARKRSIKALQYEVLALHVDAGAVTLSVNREFPLSSIHQHAAFRLCAILQDPADVLAFYGLGSKGAGGRGPVAAPSSAAAGSGGGGGAIREPTPRTQKTAPSKLAGHVHPTAASAPIGPLSFSSASDAARLDDDVLPFPQHVAVAFSEAFFVQAKERPPQKGHKGSAVAWGPLSARRANLLSVALAVGRQRKEALLRQESTLFHAAASPAALAMAAAAVDAAATEAAELRQPASDALVAGAFADHEARLPLELVGFGVDAPLDRDTITAMTTPERPGGARARPHAPGAALPATVAPTRHGSRRQAHALITPTEGDAATREPSEVLASPSPAFRTRQKRAAAGGAIGSASFPEGLNGSVPPPYPVGGESAEDIWKGTAPEALRTAGSHLLRPHPPLRSPFRRLRGPEKQQYPLLVEGASQAAGSMPQRADVESSALGRRTRADAEEGTPYTPASETDPGDGTGAAQPSAKKRRAATEDATGMPAPGSPGKGRPRFKPKPQVSKGKLTVGGAVPTVQPAVLPVSAARRRDAVGVMQSNAFVYPPILSQLQQLGFQTGASGENITPHTAAWPSPPDAHMGPAGISIVPGTAHPIAPRGIAGIGGLITAGGASLAPPFSQRPAGAAAAGASKHSSAHRYLGEAASALQWPIGGFPSAIAGTGFGSASGVPAIPLAFGSLRQTASVMPQRATDASYVDDPAAGFPAVGAMQQKLSFSPSFVGPGVVPGVPSMTPLPPNAFAYRAEGGTGSEDTEEEGEATRNGLGQPITGQILHGLTCDDDDDDTEFVVGATDTNENRFQPAATAATKQTSASGTEAPSQTIARSENSALNAGRDAKSTGEEMFSRFPFPPQPQPYFPALSQSRPPSQESLMPASDAPSDPAYRPSMRSSSIGSDMALMPLSPPMPVPTNTPNSSAGGAWQGSAEQPAPDPGGSSSMGTAADLSSRLAALLAGRQPPPQAAAATTEGGGVAANKLSSSEVSPPLSQQMPAAAAGRGPSDGAVTGGSTGVAVDAAGANMTPVAALSLLAYLQTTQQIQHIQHLQRQEIQQQQQQIKHEEHDPTHEHDRTA